MLLVTLEVVLSLFNCSIIPLRLLVLSSLIRAAPSATKSCGLSGTIISSSSKLRVSINLSLSCVRKYRGPPRNATLPVIGLPQANTLIV